MTNLQFEVLALIMTSRTVETPHGRLIIIKNQKGFTVFQEYPIPKKKLLKIVVETIAHDEDWKTLIEKIHT